LFDVAPQDWVVSALGVGLLLFAFLVNISGNRLIATFSLLMAIVKIGGIAVFAIAGLWLADFSTQAIVLPRQEPDLYGFIGAMALAILAYKGFTTITNSGSEIVNPHKNIGRAIMIAIVICVVVYFLVALAIAENLGLNEIIAARDFALAEAARPAFGDYGLWFTVGFAIVATVSGVIASAFAVSRMLAMLTDMQLVPHSHFGMPGSIQKHTLVYTIAIAIFLTVFFDLSRIASLGAIFYITMDIVIHLGVFRHLRREINASGIILVIAIAFDVLVLGAFLWLKIRSDILIVFIAVVATLAIFALEHVFLRAQRAA
ncbi:MAG: amino acid permease, partial [Burkholderiales bacterium]|nr:amino acid permease [Burkholderiales bacterium]